MRNPAFQPFSKENKNRIDLIRSILVERFACKKWDIAQILTSRDHTALSVRYEETL